MRIEKIKSSALYYTLFLSVIFGISLGGLILMSESNRRLLMITNIETELMNNSRSGIAYGQIYHENLEESNTNYFRLFGEGYDSVKLEKYDWGVFSILKSTAKHGKQAYVMTALVGAELDDNMPSLFLVDNGRALTICGDTKLEGNCELPKAGVKRGYIEGQNYKGSQLVYGNIKTSTKDLPEIVEFSDLNIEGERRLLTNKRINENRSFNDETLVLISDHGLFLEGDTLVGRIIILAKDSIVIRGDCQLENVILSSPIVKVKSNFIGSIQIFAQNKISIEEHVTLLYPSGLILNEDNYPINKNSSIQIDQFSHIIGSVILKSDRPNFRMLPELSIAKNSRISGLVYCQGKTQLLGEIKGHIYTEKFYLKTKSSSYENHVLNGVVSNNLPNNFTAADIFNSRSKLKLISWLN